MARARISLPAALILIATAGLPVATFGADDSPLPIKTITLYRSGVGAFERTGQVAGDASIPLRFQTDQINDILKSLVLLDLSGGSVGAVSYDSNEPLARRLDAFRINLADNPSIPVLLNRLRGEKVRLTVSTDTPVEGTILGVENRATPVGTDDPSVIDEPFVTLVTASGIRAIAVSQVRSFELSDAELAAELSSALAMLADNRAERATTVDLNFTGGAAGGNAARDVYVAYVHEMPVWKTTYRLVLPEKDADKPTLQGWAIVENVTDQDWTDVRLSLASGKPVAFQMDLYEPLFAYRPMVPVPFAAGLMPRVYEGGIALGSADAMGERAAYEMSDRMEAPAAKSFARQRAGASMESDSRTYAFNAIPTQAMQSAASGGEVGQQFFYTLDMPISIERQRSAMLPILTAPITGERVSIYSAQQGGTNPMRGVKLTNDSGLSLMPGPIAVYDSGAYAGDAQIPNTPRNDTQLLAYAADLDVSVVTDSRSDETINSIRIASGLVIKEVTRKVTASYTFENSDDAHARTIIIENPRMGSDWETISPKPYETTDTIQRFETTVPKGGSDTATIVQQRVERASMAITSFDEAAIARYTTRGKMSKAVADAIRKAADMQGAINRIDRDIANIDQEIDSIAADQDRIRRNMGSIDRNSELYARYMKTLGDQETRLDQVRVQREQSFQQRTAKQQELENYLRNLNVD